MTFNRRTFMRLAGAIASPWIASGVIAQEGSTRVLVGFPSGGAVDIAARFICPMLSDRLGRWFEVENLPGESGNTATARVVAAAPDGRTLLLCGPVNTINTTLFPRLPFRFDQDLAAVAGLYRVPLIVEVHPHGPVQSAAELIAYARSRPGVLKVGYAGKGTPQHIGIELFKSVAQADMTLIAYTGSAPALEDLLAGRIDVMFDPVPSSIGHVKAGRLRALALTGTKPLASLPGVPLMSELVPGYEAGSWFGLCAPSGTPADLVDALNAACNAALREPVALRRLDELGATPMTGSPVEFAAFIRQETQKYARVIAEAKIAQRGGRAPG